MKRSVQKIYTSFFLIFFSFLVSSQNIINIETISNNSIQYISLIDFAKSQNLRYTYYESKEKLEINYKNYKLFFSPRSSYMKINNKVYNMTYETIYKKNIIYAPAITLQNIFEKTKIPIRILSIEDNYVKAKTNIYNINEMSIVKKKNGISLKLLTNKYFSAKKVAASINKEGWLNVTVLNGVVDSLQLKKYSLQHPFVKSHIIQSESSSQISLLCREEIDDIIVQTSGSYIELLLTVKPNVKKQKMENIKKDWIIDTIVIDPGHGGKDPGAIGINRIQEKTIALDIARQLGKLLERNLNMKVIYTRDDDTFIPLWKRTQIANNSGGDLFISIHANSTSKSSSIKGFETFLLRVGKTDDAIEVAKRENSVIELEEQTNKYIQLTDEKLIMATMSQNADMKASEDLADLIQQNLAKNISSKNRGVKQAGFHVLIGASMPNVLVEVGFISNPTEANLLGKSQYRRNIAKSMYNAIEEYKKKYEQK